jgi:hypothetical protein
VKQTGISAALLPQSPNLHVVYTVVFSGKLLDQYVPVTQFSYLFPVGNQEEARRRNTLQALLSICSLKTTG